MSNWIGLGLSYLFNVILIYLNLHFSLSQIFYFSFVAQCIASFLHPSLFLTRLYACQSASYSQGHVLPAADFAHAMIEEWLGLLLFK